jgi:hypothetical protein
MRETTRRKAIENNLKLVGGIAAKDMSKVILLIERLKENKNIKYYVIESIVFNENTHDGEIKVSFWGEN